MAIQNTVLIVEDHPLFLNGLTYLLSSEPGFTVIGEATDRAQALEIFDKKRPNMVLVDLTLGKDNGLDLIKDIHHRSSETKMLVLSMHDEKFYADRSLAAGAKGYCMKDEAVENIVSALKTVAAGKVWLSARLRNKGADPDASDGKVLAVHKLTDREFQVFALIGSGMGTLSIAERLGLSTKTIDTHKENIKAKLECATSQDLREYAIVWQSSAP